ncbi:MAG TPA: dihydrodipicolinate synthase family protein [Beijerinckiaceae bacterium]|jgi:4-hydroxy-tetrahydrodipicolinate synthase
MKPSLRFGISAALVTPFAADGRVDTPRLADHSRWCLGRGLSSVTLFGTTGEGPSVAARERDAVAAALIADGLAPSRVVEAVIAASVEEAAWGTARALERGARAVLLAPPFYFAPTSDEALAAWFAAVFDTVGPSLRDVILYHIPGLTRVPLSPDLVARVRAQHPGAVIGVKDSAGDREATMRLLARHPDLAILVGDERYLGTACAAGAAGSICGMANLVPEAILTLAERGEDDPRVIRLVDAVLAGPVIPGLKALVAAAKGDPGFAAPRPPLAAMAPPVDATEALRAFARDVALAD